MIDRPRPLAWVLVFLGLVVGALLISSAGCPGPPWARSRAGLGWRWPREPRVGFVDSDLEPHVSRSLARWEYGTLVWDGCHEVDVCVLIGTWAHAGPRPGSDVCYSEVPRPIVWATVAHEIGHCFGLGHSDNPRSVMYPYLREGMEVLEEDRSVLRD